MVLTFIDMCPTPSGLAGQFIGALAESHYFWVVASLKHKISGRRYVDEPKMSQKMTQDKAKVRDYSYPTFNQNSIMIEGVYQLFYDYFRSELENASAYGAEFTDRLICVDKEVEMLRRVRCPPRESSKPIKITVSNSSPLLL